MRVRISYTVDVSDERRRAINEFYGRPGLADRAEVKRWYEGHGDSMDLDLEALLGDEPLSRRRDP